LHSQNSGHARELLASRLSAYQDASGERVAVVFDGSGETSEEPRLPGRIQIFYSGSGRTADDVIERLVYNYAGRYQLTVATEDNAERETVAALGGHWISAAGLAERLQMAERRLEETLLRMREGGRSL